MSKMLWIGDAACGSGFGRASDEILGVLRHRWDVSVLGINFRGDHKPPGLPYPIYPAYTAGSSDAIGLSRMKEVLDKVKPEVIVVQTNPWHVPMYLRAFNAHGYGDVPVVGIIAVEGKNCQGRQLNGLNRAIFWTEFGRQEAIKGGMKIPSDVVPLGVDTKVFHPGDKLTARRKLDVNEVPEDAFIVTNVNRNQARKRIDLSVIFFAEWIQRYNIRDAYLHLHLLPGSTVALKVAELGFYCGISDRLIQAEPRDIYNGAPEDYLVATYRATDVFMTTTLGEGFGLTVLEAMACGIPVIAGDYAALGEWARDAALLVECNSEGVMPDVNGMIGSAPSKEAVITALDELYRNPEARAIRSALSLQLANSGRFNWSNIGRQFAESIETGLLV